MSRCAGWTGGGKGGRQAGGPGSEDAMALGTSVPGEFGCVKARSVSLNYMQPRARTHTHAHAHTPSHHPTPGVSPRRPEARRWGHFLSSALGAGTPDPLSASAPTPTGARTDG